MRHFYQIKFNSRKRTKTVVAFSYITEGGFYKFFGDDGSLVDSFAEDDVEFVKDIPDETHLSV